MFAGRANGEANSSRNARWFCIRIGIQFPSTPGGNHVSLANRREDSGKSTPVTNQATAPHPIARTNELRRNEASGGMDEPVAAIGLTGTTLDINDGNLESLVKSLKAAAAKIGAALGTLAETTAAKDTECDPCLLDGQAPSQRSVAAGADHGLDPMRQGS